MTGPRRGSHWGVEGKADGQQRKEMPWQSWKTSLEAVALNEVEKSRRKLKSGKRWTMKLLL